MSLTFIKSATRPDDTPPKSKPHVALVGRSNVGKSSLINDLARQKNLARVSAEPGRTQTINFFDAGTFYLVDLPGYGFAKTSKAKRDAFSGMVRDYLWQTEALKEVFLIIDSRIGVTDLDRDMLEYLFSGKISTTVIVNKIDKLSHSESINLMRKLESDYPYLSFIPHSSVTGLGREDIWRAMQRTVKGNLDIH